MELYINAMTSSPGNLLLQFIEDESSALRRGERGAFYPDNHHLITPLIVRAPRLLSEEDRVELYFHLLRGDVCPSIKAEGEFELLRAAHARVLPLLSEGYPACTLPRARGLFLFGLDDRGALPDEPPATLASYIGHLAFWRYADSFWHMPGMLKKRAKFVELAQDGARLARVRKVLLGMRLREDLPMATCLWFWSFVFLALQDEAAGAAVVDKILAESVSVDDAELIRSCLLRYLAVSERPGLAALVEARP
ncbi:hypothetical protein KDH83_11895 [Achromobacter sp. Marseille-Q0513]|uniref:hypothetical protein n=1 Tax=Achromobacter sp. Marseille-Q0513 TaxID=2829161 RepID=UPI001B917368|nr:hypothetical protein [Achromobacter sp. Marseille-Q0513]MBR8654004.1 hypothetical protein [Achromobacter sp. Marseille-Q0513]